MVEVTTYNYCIQISKSFDHKSSVKGKLGGINRIKDAEIAVPLIKIFMKLLVNIRYAID